MPIPEAPAPPVLAFVNGIGAIDAAEWDACAAQDGPFLGHAYLAAAESSAMVAPATGWAPLHLTVRDAQARLIAVAPAYLKGHSNDEYWLDHPWATGYRLAGGRYYPKLLVGAPFAPVSGRRLLLGATAPASTAPAMIAALEGLARDLALSTVHASFADEGDRDRLIEAGWLARHDIQYEWSNAGYRDFADFLDALPGHRRRKIRRERRLVAASGARFREVEGDRLRSADVAVFIDLLNDLHRRKNTRQPLTRNFVSRLGEALGRRLILSFAEEDGVAVGALLHVVGDRRLHIRNWGCLPGRRFLHFETCYYRLIERAIALGCEAIEGGHGGLHKLERGFSPKLVHSLHWFLHEGLRAAVGERVARENATILETFARQAGGA